MAAGFDAAPPHMGTGDQAAGGRPFGIGATGFGSIAATLLENGYEPIPILPGTKKPYLDGWSTIPLDDARIDDWAARIRGHGTGLRPGALVGVDIDTLDSDPAHSAEADARRILGHTPLIRIGLWPKRLLLYRTGTALAKCGAAGVESLARGQQFVAFGVHPDTGRPY